MTQERLKAGLPPATRHHLRVIDEINARLDASRIRGSDNSHGSEPQTSTVSAKDLLTERAVRLSRLGKCNT